MQYKSTSNVLMLDLRNEYDVVIYVSPEGVDIENNGVRETNVNEGLLLYK